VLVTMNRVVNKDESQWSKEITVNSLLVINDTVVGAIFLAVGLWPC